MKENEILKEKKVLELVKNLEKKITKEYLQGFCEENDLEYLHFIDFKHEKRLLGKIFVSKVHKKSINTTFSKIKNGGKNEITTENFFNKPLKNKGLIQGSNYPYMEAEVVVGTFHDKFTPSFLVGLDTEFISFEPTLKGKKSHGENKKKRFLLTVQFSFEIENEYYNLVIFNYSKKVYSFEIYYQYVLKFIQKHKIYDNKIYNSKERFSLTFVYHYGKADFSIFSDFKKNIFDGKLSDIGGGLSSLKGFKKKLKYQKKHRNHDTFYLKIYFRDTINYATEGKSLEQFIKNSKYSKIENEIINKSNMLLSFIENTKITLLYAIHDTLGLLDTVKEIFGMREVLPITNGAEAASKAKEFLEHKYGWDTKEKYEFYYRGLVDKNETGLHESNGKYRKIRDWAYKTYKWQAAFDMATNSYRGGLNQCYTHGIYTDVTYDYDLKNAYPTFMSWLPLINYDTDPIQLQNATVGEALNLLSQFREFSCAVALVEYDFNKVKKGYEQYKKYPCITEKSEGSLITVRKNEQHLKSQDTLETTPTYVFGAELYRALKIGAITKIHDLIYIPTITFEDEKGAIKPIRIFGDYIKTLIYKRNEAKAKYGKGSDREKYYKLLINSLYGKFAQGLLQAKTNKYTRDGITRELMPPCDVTNPFYASMTTSLCRLTLTDTIANLDKKGYKIHSVTTDGFITNAPEEVVSEILKEFEHTRFLHYGIENVREMLTGEKSYYEIKHSNYKGFLNISTRFNLSFNEGGVNAHGGVKKYEKTFDGRKKLINELEANGYFIFDGFTKLPTTGDIVYKNSEYSGIEIEKKMKGEYDFKRKIEEESIEEVAYDLDGIKLKIANFSTTTYDTIADFVKMKNRIRSESKVITKNPELLKRKLEHYERLDKGETKRLFKPNSKDNEKDTFLYLYFLDKINNLLINSYFKKLTYKAKADFLNEIEYGSKNYFNVNKMKKFKLRASEDKVKHEEYPEKFISLIEEKILPMMTNMKEK